MPEFPGVFLNSKQIFHTYASSKLFAGSSIGISFSSSSIVFSSPCLRASISFFFLTIPSFQQSFVWLPGLGFPTFLLPLFSESFYLASNCLMSLNPTVIRVKTIFPIGHEINMFILYHSHKKYPHLR